MYVYIYLIAYLTQNHAQTNRLIVFLCVLVTASEPYLAYLLYAELFTSSTN